MNTLSVCGKTNCESTDEGNSAVVAPTGGSLGCHGARQTGSYLHADSFWRSAGWIAIVIGLLLRLSQYFYDRSLFLDEAFVATSIKDRGFLDLLGPLQFDQRAPAAFLLAVKAAWNCLGHSDLALRFVPLCSGVLALFAFRHVANRLLARPAAVLAMLLFALSPPQIFYASDLKQYSTDTLAALLVLGLAIQTDWLQLTWRKVAELGVFGAVILWFSFPAVFVLSAIGVVLILHLMLQKQYTVVPRLALMFGVWGIGLGLLYWIQVRHFDPNPGWKSLWGDGFPAQDVTLLGLYEWTVGRLFHLTGVPTGFRAPGTACLLLLAGVIGWSRENRFHLACLLVPVLACVLAAMMGIYPFSGRVILFLGPLAILAVSRGVQEFVAVAKREAASLNLKQEQRTDGWHAKLRAIGWQVRSGSFTWLLGVALSITLILGIGQLHRHSWLHLAVLGFIVCIVFDVTQRHVSARRWAMRFFVGAIVCLIMRYPAQTMFEHTVKGLMYRNPLFWDYKFEETKPLLAYIQERWEPGDRVYLYSQSYVAFEFYADRYGIPKNSCVRGIPAGLAVPSWQDLRRDVEKMERHPRVWFVFTHVWMNKGVSEREVCTRILGEEGSLQAELVMPKGYDASVHLYEFPHAVAATARGNVNR